MAPRKSAKDSNEPMDPEELLAGILSNTPDDGSFDLLGSMLDDAMEEDIAAESGIGADGTGLSIPFVAIPQANSKRYAVQEDEDSVPQNQAGKIFIGTREQHAMAESYHKSGSVRFILLDSLLHRVGRQRRGGRLMWPSKADGARDLSGGVACSSRNGVAPIPMFLGKEVLHPGLGIRLRIGMTFNAQGQEIPVMDGHICDACPFSKWGLVKDAEGNDYPALCKANTRFVLYDMDQDRIVQFSGGNLGVEQALRGRRPNQLGNQQDGSILEGIEKPFLRDGERTIIVSREQVSQLKPNQWYGFGMHDPNLGVVGLTTSLESASDMLKMRAYTEDTNNPGSYTRNERFFTLYENNQDFVGVVLSIPTYPFAPLGKPEHVGGMTVVYPVKITVVMNDYRLDGAPNPTLVPKFVVDTDHPMSMAQYAGFLAKHKEYYTTDPETSQNMRENLLGMDDIDMARSRMANAQPTMFITGGSAGYLPQSVIEDDAEFASFEAVDDDIIES